MQKVNKRTKAGEHENQAGEQENPEDDPGDQGNNEESSSDSSEESDKDNIREVAPFSKNRLNRNVQLMQHLTIGEIICFQLALAVRHQMTSENIVDQFNTLNLLFGPGSFPESKTKLWSVILLNKAGIHFMYTVVDAFVAGRRDRMNEIARCRCGYEVPLSKARLFVCLSATEIIFLLEPIPLCCNSYSDFRFERRIFACPYQILV